MLDFFIEADMLDFPINAKVVHFRLQDTLLPCGAALVFTRSAGGARSGC